MKILNFGSLNIDYVYQVEHLVRPGETLSSVDRKVFAGGKGLNQSIAMARAGAKVYHAGVVGEEGVFLTEILRRNDVDTEYIEKEIGQSTGHAVILVDQQGQNSIILYGGTNQRQNRSHIEKILNGFDKGDYLVLQNEINELSFIMDKAYERGMKVILNPSPMNEKIQSLDLNKVSMLILNEVEGRDLSGEEDPQEILKVLSETYPSMTIILTVGVNGAYYKSGEESVFQSAYKVQAVDTTGAGDTFTGYLIAALSRGETVENSMNLAAKASAISVTRNGAEASIPIIAEVLDYTFD
ncbi:ribokinase [Proteiniclasticum ruminis]|uniref:Ribokinase n=1 Tax=Proteiniclasticum ruminis TaxID=398199 RepID=A0A1I5BZ50_9CLOT|nr:ribokinase [Proteiniclasticum ruminis]SFN79957.1 ribokinase [Proteiniclasticum ruminis]